MRYLSHALVALSALSLAACETSVYSVTQERLYSPARAHFASGVKDLPTFIRGNPFEASQELIDAMLIQDMRHGMLGVDTALRRRPNFTIDGAGSGSSGYWVALALNPAAGVDAATLCADPKNVEISKAPVREGRIEARMVFCYDGRVLSTSHGVLDGAIDRNDPRFHRMIASMTRELFPFRKFRDSSSDGLI